MSQIAKTTLGVGYGGQAAGNRVVKWERKGNRILLRNVLYDVIADSKLPVARAVQAANNDTIIMSFNIEALGKDDSAVIDLTRLFTSEVTEFSARTRLRSRGFDVTRSFIEKTKSFPTNIEVEVSQTYTSPPDPTPGGGGGQKQPAPNPFAQGMRAGTNATVVMHYSMVKLPEKPMMPRLFDERVGYFLIRKIDYGADEHRAPQRRYITRWRLEKKDPNAESLRTSQADRLLRRSGNADKMDTVDQERHRGLATCIRGRQFQECDYREGSTVEVGRS